MIINASIIERYSIPDNQRNYSKFKVNISLKAATPIFINMESIRSTTSNLMWPSASDVNFDSLLAKNVLCDKEYKEKNNEERFKLITEIKSRVFGGTNRIYYDRQLKVMFIIGSLDNVSLGTEVPILLEQTGTVIGINAFCSNNAPSIKEDTNYGVEKDFSKYCVPEPVSGLNTTSDVCIINGILPTVNNAAFTYEERSAPLSPSDPYTIVNKGIQINTGDPVTLIRLGKVSEVFMNPQEPFPVGIVYSKHLDRYGHTLTPTAIQNPDTELYIYIRM